MRACRPLDASARLLQAQRGLSRRATLVLLTTALAVLIGHPRTSVTGAMTGCTTPDPIDDASARSALQTERPFAPTDKDLFHTFALPEWGDAAPLGVPGGPEPTERQVRAQLRAFLERRFPCEPQRVLGALAVLSDPRARQKIPEPTLRAALAALAGTIGQPAIGYVLSEVPLTAISFGSYLLHGEGLPHRVAGTYRYGDGTVQAIVDRRYRSLPFPAFSALLLHEALHLATDQDGAGLPEEAVATSLEALVYMQMLLTEPSLALLPDELTRSNSNHMALVRLNSAPQGSDRLTLFVPGSTVEIDPLADEPLTEFYDYYDVYSAPDDPGFRDLETSGNSLLRDVLSLLAEGDAAPPADADFDRATLEFIDQNHAALTAQDLLDVACVLRLDAPCAADQP